MNKKNKTVGPAVNITTDNYKGEPSDHPAVKLERLKRLESTRTSLVSAYSIGYFNAIRPLPRSLVNPRPSKPFWGNGFFGRITADQWECYANRLEEYYEKEKELDQEDEQRKEEMRLKREKRQETLNKELKPIDEEINKLKAELKLK